MKIPHLLKKVVSKQAVANVEESTFILNEAVNFDLETIFIAVPKTGTTSVRTQIRPKGKALISNPHLNIMQVRDVLYAYLLKTSLGQNINYPTEGVLTDAEIRNNSRQIFNSFFKFSSVRNPWARAVSLYFRTQGVQVSQKISFDDFCEGHHHASDTCLHPTLHQNQLDWLVDESGQVVLDYIYKLEDFSEAINEISKRTDGRIQLQNKTSNKNPKSNSSSYRDIYSDYTRRLIAKRFEKDIDFFEYTF
ncbi:MAG: sulfotransferase family 2 domain-containing protein [Cyanobacteria bacterium J06623_5]